MLDVLPPESDRWTSVVARVRDAGRSASASACSLTPIVEHYEVFAARRRDAPTSCARRCTTSSTRAAGGSRCGPRAPRRSCARSCSTARPRRGRSGTSRPNFRYEQPQEGRYRQHWQLGVEVARRRRPDVDVEIIELLRRLLPRPRSARRAAAAQLDGRRRDARRATARCCSRTGARTPTLLGDEMERAEANPLRILDSKRARLAGRCSSARRSSAST